MDSKEVKKEHIVLRWSKFMRDKESTEFWTKEDFELFLENEEVILSYTNIYTDDKIYLTYLVNIKQKEIYKQKLDRLKEIYNERFKEIDSEETQDHTKYTKHEIFYLLQKLGLTDIKTYQQLSETKKATLLSKILNCDLHSAKKYKNQTDHRYTVNDIQRKKIDVFFDNLIKGK